MSRLGETAGIVVMGVLLSAFCLGCAGGSANPQPAAPGPQDGTRQDLPGLHDLGGGPYSRLAAASSGELLVDGDARIDEAGADNRAVPESHAYIIQPGATEEYAWALYAISGLTDARPVELSLEINAAAPEGGGDPLPLSCMVGVADYTSYVWEWFGPFSEPTLLTDLLPLNGDELRQRYVNADGVLHVVVVAPRDESFAGAGNPDGLTAAEIVKLRVGTRAVSDPAYCFTKPHYTPIDTIALGQGTKGGSALDPDQQYVTLTWTHIADPADQALEAQEYTVSRRGPMDDAALVLCTLAAPDEDCTDPTDNDGAIPQVVPGATYTYYLRATNAQGSTPLDSREITIPLLAPVLTASDGNYTSYIALNWTVAEGATGYALYRDSQDASGLLATLGEITSWDDASIDDYVPHSYWIKAFNEYGQSEFSNEAVGTLGAMPVGDLQADPVSGSAPLTVTLDASGSYDPDDGDSPGDGIYGYEWDYDGDGTWDETPGAAIVTHVYETVGQYTARVRVIDDDGMYGGDEVTIQVDWPAPPQDLLAFPVRCFPAIDQLRIDYYDPLVGRYPRLIYNPIVENYEPADPTGFNDVLKTNGDEFPVSRVAGTSYPLVAVKETPNPNDITSPTDNIPGVYTVELNPHRIVVDIAVLTLSGQIGDPDKVYSFRLFDPGASVLGQGTFNVAPLNINPAPPIGRRWGVNVWDREAFEISDRVPQYDYFDVNGHTVGFGAPAPDVLWVEFSDGWMYDFTEDDAEIGSTENVKLYIVDEVTAEHGYLYLKPVILGVSAQGDMIAIHPVAPEDFYNPNAPGGGPGILRPGHIYTVSLDDLHNPGIDFTFNSPADHSLSVSGTNPNPL